MQEYNYHNNNIHNMMVCFLEVRKVTKQLAWSNVVKSIFNQDEKEGNQNCEPVSLTNKIYEMCDKN